MATRARAPRAATERPRSPRLTAAARKTSILEAARRAFTETGDVKGTTIRHIADRGGISEGVIYRHFESKDQLFFEAVVEPLRAAVDQLVAEIEVVDQGALLTIDRQQQKMQMLYRQLTSTFADVLPLLGLVLFGDPKVARRFYRDHFAVAMDRLATAWTELEHRYGVEEGGLDISARAVMGIALVLALEARHTRGFDRDRALELVSRGTMHGFFPPYEPEHS